MAHIPMLCAKRKLTGEIVNAYFASKAHGPFKCPDCGDEVIWKTGNRTVNHFAHVNPLACRYAENESEEHRRCKMEIFQALQKEPRAHSVMLERPLGTNRPDVSANINGVPVAIEVQISSLSLDTIARRTMEYARKGIYVLWLLQWTPELNARRYSPRLWEKWIHAAYFGRVYYWVEGLTVVSYHFDPHFKSVPKKSWYSEDGEKMTGGGYSQRLKRHRTAVRGQTLNLATDFVPHNRDWWEGNDLTIPFAKLFMEKYERPETSGGFRRRT
jgi:competence protein CoiA